MNKSGVLINPTHFYNPVFPHQPQKAASRMLSYYEAKVLLFGREVAASRPKLLISDLSDGALLSLRAYGMRLLPGVDSTGRSVLVVSCEKFGWEDKKDIARLCMYLLEVAQEKETSQTKGVVIVGYILSPNSADMFSCFDRIVYKTLFGFLRQAYPATYFTRHVMLPTIWANFVAPVCLYMLGKETRSRVKIFDSVSRKEEFLGSLEDCGIPLEKLPTDIGGESVLDIESWIEHRRATEDAG